MAAINMNKARVTMGQNKFRKLQKSHVDYLRGDADEPPQLPAAVNNRNRPTEQR